MATTQNDYIGNNSKTNYTFTFPYLKETDIKVQLDATDHFDWHLANATTVAFDTAPGQNVKIKIYRETDTDTAPGTFYAGSAIKSEDLNDNFTQSLYAAQEINARYMSNLGGTMTGDLTMGEDASVIFEGATDDNYETTLTVADPTADRIITLPNVTGTVITTGDTGTVTSTMLTDGTIVNADVNASAAIAQSKLNIANATTSAAGYQSAADKTKLDGIETAATADQTNAEIRAAVEAATDSNVFTDADHTKLNGIEASATADQSNAEIRTAVEAATDSNVFTDADHTKLNGIAASANNYSISADLLDEDDFATDSATKVPSQQSAKAYIGTYAQPKDADLTTLAGMQSGTASILAGGTALTSTLSELNLLDGKSIVTTISSPTDVQIPTAQAVEERIESLVTDVGGFRPIANETSFPATNPDPEDNAGTIVSIKALAGNITSNGSGVVTIANGAGTGNTVTINGFANNDTIEAGKGLLVETTSTLHTYTFHRETLAPADVASASALVSDFNDRYQVAGSAPSTHPDGSALTDGDLWFNTSANVMNVYDLGNTSYAPVTSVGDYKLLTILDTDGSVFDGANQSFNLKDGSNAAVVTSAGQLIVSVNGVIQKPNAGTSAPTEGFALVDSDTIIFSNAPGAGASVFVTLIGSATSVNTPATNSVVEAAIQTNVVSEEKLKISNAPTNTHVLTADATVSGGMKWAATANASPTTTRGDIIYRGASADARLAKGTSGQYLKIGANDPEWADVVGAVADGCIFENDLTISNDHTIASGKGAHSVGPITVNATVTVNGNWVVS